ncbi:hypothetical protein [Okeania sp. SIO1I7]|uniref:hypothetical protein n=1 Tax=Okeania sp. SIO1I7 TaxID=2607772 RepID=UPI0013FA8B6F|nr:hypothetical protein [Okeania sp. SIO1I7]NET30000.1 hypothetical protein [Okeania sp. SIO1I7]
MLADLTFEEKEEIILNGIMLKIAATTLARAEGVEPNVIVQRLLVVAEEKLGKVPPEDLEKAVAQMDAERVSDSEAKYALMNICAVPADDFP